jgi:cellulose synthase/poly-beta-1,6-N-acetylglucosamine synthase-like glycosyltransferase
VGILKFIFFISISLVFYAYFVYPVVLLAFRRRPETRDRRPETLPLVSIVIAAYNEERVIRERLDNLLKIDYPKDKLEIVIASDGSDDDTNKIVSEHAKDGITLAALSDRSGKVNVLNRVIPGLKGDIVVLSDANTFYKSDAIRNLIRNFSDTKIGCVCGELVFQSATDSEVGKLEGFYWRYEQFLKRVEGANGSLLGANGGIYAIRKNLFETLPSNTVVEDFVLPMKILEKGYKVIYEPDAIAYEETSKKMMQEMERRIRIGAGDFQALLLTWKMLNPLHGFKAFAYFSHKVIRWFAPFLLIAAFIANIILAGNEPYRLILVLQSMFYLAALVGRILSQFGVRFKLFGLPYYFISMNIALFLGFIRFCSNSQSVTWKRTER